MENTNKKTDFILTEKTIRTIITEKLPEWFKKELSSDYSNPLRDAINTEIKNQEGIIKTLVREMLSTILHDEKFKAELVKQIIGRIIERGMK